MENFYYLKYTNERGKISFAHYKKNEFKLVFGGIFERILSNFIVNMYTNKNIDLINADEEERIELFFKDFVNNWNENKLHYSPDVAINFKDIPKEYQEKILLKLQSENKIKQNTKSVGNGEGSLCYSKSLKKWEFYYFNNDGERKVIRQRKKESVKDFKARATEIKDKLNKGTYVEKNYETIISLAEKHILQKLNNKETQKRTYRRDLETLEQIKKTCSDFCDIPIQKVTIDDIEKAKLSMIKYANSTISKIWSLLRKVFAIASSPSRRILEINIMLDENLKKPISEKPFKKVKALSLKERERLNYILDHDEKDHKYRNILKMQLASAMRIGEVLARSKTDYNKEDETFNVHNTLTEDENYNVILGEHTKTYNKKTQIDEGQRYLPLDVPIFLELKEIIIDESSKKITNIYGLLFWDYEENTFITPKEINSYLDRINEKYKICKEKLSSHRLRHTTITYWRHVLKLPMEVIQYLAGHVEESDVTDEVYIDTDLEMVKYHLSGEKIV